MGIVIYCALKLCLHNLTKGPKNNGPLSMNRHPSVWIVIGIFEEMVHPVLHPNMYRVGLGYLVIPENQNDVTCSFLKGVPELP